VSLAPTVVIPMVLGAPRKRSKVVCTLTPAGYPPCTARRLLSEPKVKNAESCTSRGVVHFDLARGEPRHGGVRFAPGVYLARERRDQLLDALGEARGGRSGEWLKPIGSSFLVGP
jgi:hypothetical protein